MYIDFHKEQPLHQILLNWLPWTTKRPSTRVNAASVATIGVTSQLQAITAQQIAISLRMQGVQPEDETMLASLESLATAGEISFADFVGRMQNLFPRAMEALDISLRLKIASLLMPAKG